VNVGLHRTGVFRSLNSKAVQTGGGSKKYPDLCRLDKTYEQGGVSYVLDKSRLSIRLQPPYSEERRRKASENAKQNGFASQTE